ncbi:MAG: acyltransferase [Sphingobacteriales bacterium]|nr:acyltransferase [Sphingobacteriales bacterium]
MRSIIEHIVRWRNPQFSLHPSVNTIAIISFATTNFWSLVRGLRWFFYGKNPQMCLLGKNVQWFNAPKIKFGKYLKLGDQVYIGALGKEGIIIGDNTGIGAYSRVVVSTSLSCPGEFIKIGNNVGIGEFAYLGGGGGLEIGDECIIGQYFSCHPENHNSQDLSQSIRHQGISRKGIKIEKNCWIGSKVTILDGVVIGEGSIIAAGAVVTASFPAYSVIGGVPAKLLKSR